MAELQTDYSGNLADDYRGKILDGRTSSIFSRTVAMGPELDWGAAAFVAAARCCSQTPSSGFLGIAVETTALPRDQWHDANSYGPGENAAIMSRGATLVIASESVTKGDQAYTMPVTDLGGGASMSGGMFKTSTGNIELTGWHFDDDANEGDLVRLMKN